MPADMKKAIPFYIVVAVLWAVVATAIGAGPTAGNFFYRVGRNAPGAFLWPWEVVKSPYTLGKWAFGAKRAPVFEGMYQQCRTHSSSSICECRVEVMQKEFTAPEFEAIDASLRRGEPMSDRLALAALGTKRCN